MSQQVITIGTANAGGGDTLFAASTKTVANFAELYKSRVITPPKISWHGDSIANQGGRYSNASPWFWAQVLNPRRMMIVRDDSIANNDKGSGYTTSGECGGDFAVSSRLSGSLYNGLNRTGTLLYTGTTGDMNDATRLARIAAYAPDIMIFQIGANEHTYSTAAVDATILNVKDVINANPNPSKKIIIQNVYPRNGVTPSDNVMEYIAWAKRKELTTPGYFFLDTATIAYDNTTLFNWLSGQSLDGTHPGIGHAMLAYGIIDNIFDRIGIQKSPLRSTFLGDQWTATRPGGNMLQSGGGLFTGSVATTNGNVSGNWNTQNSSNALSGKPAATQNLTAVGSTGTINDTLRGGIARNAQTITFGTTGGVLTNTSTLSFSLKCVAGSVQPGKLLYSQCGVQIANLVGCTSIQIGVRGGQGTAPGLTTTFDNFGFDFSNPFLTSATPTTMHFVNPWHVLQASGGNDYEMRFLIQFLNGSDPTGGSISLFDAMIASDITSAYD